ncbi:MAG: Maf family nucleotide pyrophosphatase [Muribaculaceae bacterium]|nr:Maf family nucleotide pyrophosphatase [Muribaculaceae bacterium]
MLKNLQKYHIMLGSKSPRRRELLQMMRIPFDVVNINGVEEIYPDSMPAEEVPQFLSAVKADAFIPHLRDNDMIITADTLVILGERIMGKPASTDDACAMLRDLAGRTHRVVTGVTVATLSARTSFTTSTDVEFAPLSDEEIRYYVDNFQPLDKAGAYGIQEWIGAVAVRKIDGSFYNVMGLPVHRLWQELKLF